MASADSSNAPQPMTSLQDRALAYLQLCRAPNVFTAAADVMMGQLFVRGSFSPVGPFVGHLLASCCIYTGGLVLNDVFDLETDRQERPERPLPSGRISLPRARRLGIAWLVAGWLCGALGTLLLPADDGYPLSALAVVTVLVVAVVAYDAGVKQTPLGPLLMGSCRGLNVLLGMTAAPRDEQAWFWGWHEAHLCVAGGVGLYIAGLTWFGRGEAGISRRGALAGGLTVMAAGWALTGALAHTMPQERLVFRDPTLFYLLLAMLAVPVLRRALAALLTPGPRQVQLAVKQGIWSLIWLDAAIAVAIAPFGLALAIVALFVPMLVLGRWVYST